MKKLLILAACIGLALSLPACHKDDNYNNGPRDKRSYSKKTTKVKKEKRVKRDDRMDDRGDRRGKHVKKSKRVERQDRGMGPRRDGGQQVEMQYEEETY